MADMNIKTPTTHLSDLMARGTAFLGSETALV
jgi:hypothetical protein